MKTFKTYLEEGKKFDSALLGASLAGLAVVAPFVAHRYKANREAEQEMARQQAIEDMPQHEYDAMMRDITGDVHGTTTPTTPPVKSASQTKPPTPAAPAKPTYHHDAIKQMVIQDEGIRTKPYLDSRGILTVGIGHNLEATGSKDTFRRAFGSQGDALHAHASKRGSLTKDQVTKLFDADYEHHLQKAIKLTPNLHEHPPEVQAVIVSGTYRGHWGGSPATRKLFNQGKFKEAAKELLNNDEFRRENAKTENRGVADRMLRDAKVLHDYGTKTQS